MRELIDRVRAALAGRYTILREIGHGGMAVVFLADDARHGRQVAVKVVRPDVLSALGPERFEREIAFAARLSHPHILPLFDSGLADGLVFFVMPFVDGESLAERLARERPLPLEDAVKIARDVAAALAYAHAQGVIHRDIKPENILLEGGEARVADFGVARAMAGVSAEVITTSGLVVGTPSYMSPEQATGERNLDARSDLYALGCVLYEMLTGEPPFSGVTAQAVMARQAFDTPTPVSVLRPGVPAPLGELVHRMLRKLPADRPSSASEVVRALEGSGTPAPAPAAATRRRSWRGLFALGGLLVGGIVVWGLTRTGRERLDPNRIAILPIRASSGTMDSTRSAEITGALVSALNASGFLSAVEVRPGPADGPEKVGHAVGAGRWITGTLFEGDSLRLALEISPSSGDAPMTVVMPLGSAAWSVGSVAAGRLIGTLLPSNAGGARVPLPLLQGRSPAALAHFYLGDEEYRRASFAEALAHFRAALGEDSTFAYAALRGAQAASWAGDTAAAATLIGALGRRVDSLPPKYSAFALGLMAYQQGEADSAVSRFRQVLAIDPTAADAWMALGEVYAHLLPLTGFIDTLAENAFRRVRELDPTFAPVLPHLIEAAYRRGDTTAAGLLGAFAAGHPDTLESRYLQLAVGCALGGTRRIRWAEEAAGHPEAVYQAAEALSAAGLRQADCAEAAWQAVSAADPSGSRYFGNLMMRQGILVARGDTAEARSLIGSDLVSVRASQRLLQTLDAVAGAPYDAEASILADSVLGQVARSPDDVGEGQLWLVGVWLAGQHRIQDAERLHAEIVRRAAPGVSPMMRSLEAHLLLARGDTSGAIAIFKTNAPRAPKIELSWRPNQSLVADRILLAQLYLAQGHPWDAIEWASVADAPAVLADVVFLPASLRIRALAADAVGDQRLARESRQRLGALQRPAVEVK